MDWIILAITLVLLVAYIFLRRKGQISAEAAAAYIRQGAVVIDVRTPEEYGSGHLKNAINIPLQQIDTVIAARFKDKNQVLLLHCQSGMRSGVAKNKLAALGYTRAYNLGSYERATHIIERG